MRRKRGGRRRDPNNDEISSDESAFWAESWRVHRKTVVLLEARITRCEGFDCRQYALVSRA